MLLSKNNCYADENGSVHWGPPGDKWSVRSAIYGKKVFVGRATWKTIEKYTTLVDLPEEWIFDTPGEADIHFGGPKSFYKYPPDSFIIHRTYTEIAGLSFNMFWLENNYKLVGTKKLLEYEVLLYEKQR